MASSSNEAQLRVETEFDQSRQFDLVWHVVVPFSNWGKNNLTEILLFERIKM